MTVAQAAVELDEEEQELWKQLRRKRDFEIRIDEKRAHLAELHSKRRGVRASCAEAAASVEHLAREIGFARDQQREIEHDLAVLKESNRLLQHAFKASRSESGYLGAATKDPPVEDGRPEPSVQAQHEQIEHLRAHIETIRAEKVGLRQKQEALFHRQRCAEQDRNRLLGSLQDDRQSLNQLRTERIRLCEERTNLEKEIARITNQAHGAAVLPSGEPADRRQWSPSRRAESPSPSLAAEARARELHTLPGASGGVRGRVPQDSSQQLFGDVTGNFAEQPPPWLETTEVGRASSPGAAQDAQRPHWTSFDQDSENGLPTFGSA
eukprot:TRINITY_DN18194_c1_g2_i1.p1 TRINITY_DN18194_c1_g2~~TRINITY_DN18194_c1_g2_i1.p1  ORF type:complete len:347 (-),score=56.61 TRINITY_DN18194_c1_g2_i1:102-1070(-)